MTFLPLLLPVLVAVVLLWGLGGFLSWAVGLRGFWAVAAAPAFAVTLIAGTAVVATWVGMPWSVLPVLVLTFVLGIVIRLVRRAFPGQAPTRRGRAPRGSAALALALVAAAVVLSVRVLEIVQAPGGISQTFDNIFHLNGVRYALAEGTASSLRLGYMTSSDGSLPFYPAAWHGVASLVVQLSGASIPVAINALVLTVSALVWPMAVVLLVRTLFGRALPITVAAALLAASLPAFPILLLDYGVLYPLQLSLALLPVALAATLRLLRIVPQEAPRGSGWWALILIGVIPGLTLAHPGGFVAWLALSAPMMVLFFARLFRAHRAARARLWIASAAVGYIAVGAVLVRVLRPPAEARGWPTQMTITDAVWQVLSVSMWYLVPAGVAAVCVVAGIVWALIDRTPRALAALAMYGVGALLFVTVAALPWSSLRDALTGSWYNNLPRLAAILAVTIVPMGAYGAGRTWIALVTRTRLGRRLRGGSPALRTVLGALVAAALIVGLQADGAMSRAVAWASPLYRLDAESPLLTADEYALLQRVPDEVPPGIRIAGSPFTGASLAYAISDRPVLMPHALMVISDDLQTINDGLDDAEPRSAVCAALTDLDVGYVLDFGRQEVHVGEHPLPGLDELATSSAVELVDSEGDARLYRIVACG